MQPLRKFYQDGTFCVSVPHDLHGDADYQALGAALGEQMMEDGSVHLPSLFVDLKRLTCLLDGLYSAINERARRELEVYVGRELLGAKIQEGYTGSVRYDYSLHPEYESFKAEQTGPLKSFEKKLQDAGKIFEKKRLSFAKEEIEPIEWVDEASGLSFIITPETAAVKIGEKVKTATVKL